MHPRLAQQISEIFPEDRVPALGRLADEVGRAYAELDRLRAEADDARGARSAAADRHAEALLALARSETLHGPAPELAIDEACAAVTRQLGATRTAIWLLDETKRQARILFAPAASVPRGSVPPTSLAAAPEFVQALESARVLAVADALADARTAGAWKAAGREAMAVVAVPLRAAGRVSAVLVAEDSAGRAWSVEEQEFAASVGDLGALALELLERRRAEAALRDRERQLRLLAENMSDLVCLHGLDSRLQYVSPNVRRILGYTPDELLPLDFFALLHPDDEGDARRALGELTQLPRERRTSALHRVRRKDGGWAWLETLAEVVRDDSGAVSHVQTSSREVTERVAVEQSLALSEQRYRLVVENSLDGIVLCEAPGLRIVEANPAFVKLAGRGLEEMRQLRLTDLTPDGKAPFENDGELPKGGDPLRNETVLRRRDGTLVEVHCSAIGITSAGQPLWLVVLTDVSAQKKAQMLDEDRRRILEMVAKNQPLSATMRALSDLVQRQCPGLDCRVLRAGEDAAALRPALVGPAQEWALPILSGAGKVLGCFIATSDARRSATDFDVAILQTAAQLAGIAIEQQQLTDRLAFQAQHDALTGLPNRRFFEGHLAEALRQAESARRGVAILFIDLDRFKQINDSLGHAAGDRLLVEMAKRLRSTVRAHDTVARMGGDEFTVILHDLQDPGEAVRFAHRLLGVIGAPVEVGGQELLVTASVGISIFPEDGAEPDLLLRQADLAMYRVKSQGRNGVECFTAELNAAAAERFSLEVPLRRAIENRELRLHFQPQFDREERVVGFETLVRWHHPKMGLISPARFVPIAEEAGLIVPIGTWVMQEAFATWARWRKAGMPALQLGVNVSAIQFAQPDFVALVAGSLAAAGVDPHEVELELTESVLMHDVAESRRRLTALRSLGIRIAIDDFGTGYASLSYLQRLPVDTLKVDQSFVRELDQPGGTRPLVEAIVAMGRSLGLGVIAEGVERATQLKMLRELGCERAQGYLWGSPADEATMARFLALQGMLREPEAAAS